jgi:hypothetical protein
MAQRKVQVETETAGLMTQVTHVKALGPHPATFAHSHENEAPDPFLNLDSS